MRLLTRGPIVVVLRAFSRPHGRGTPERDRGKESLPFGQLAKEFVEAFASARGEVTCLGQVGGWLEILSRPVEQADEFILAVENGGLTLQSPEKRAPGGTSASGTWGDSGTSTKRP